MSGNWPKVFRDPIHNLIPFEDRPLDRLLLDLINTREVQRLRRIKQMGTTELVFPGANHSRFAHSLGVLHVARLFLDQLERASDQRIPYEHRTILLTAALLHDVGHGPFSHAFELVTDQRHERFTCEVIQDESTEVHQRLSAFDRELPRRLAAIFDDEIVQEQRPGVLPAHLAQIVSGQLDADRCDYLLRDSYAAGINYGNFDLAWTLAQLRPDSDGQRLYLTRKGLSAVETYLFARFHLYRTVYFHKASRAAEVMLKLFFRRLKEIVELHGKIDNVPVAITRAFAGQIPLANYLDFDDHTITELLKQGEKSSDSILQRLSVGLLHRRLYKSLDVRDESMAQLRPRIVDWLHRRGLDPTYHLVVDSASDTPYEPYHPDHENPSRQIWVEDGAGRIVEVSQLSEALVQLRRTYVMTRHYVPAEIRDEVVHLLHGIEA